MKKLLFIALCAMFCLSVNAQNVLDEIDEVDDFIEVNDSDVIDVAPAPQDAASSQYLQPNMLNMVQEFVPTMDNKPLEEQLYPLGKGFFGRHLIE